MPNDREKRLPRARTAANELPSPDTKRWTPRRKAAVVEAVLSGVTTIEVCRRYDLTVEEFVSWQNMMNMHGPPGLRATLGEAQGGRSGRRGTRPGNHRLPPLDPSSPASRPAPSPSVLKGKDRTSRRASRKLPQNFGTKSRISESCQPVTSNLSPRILRCYWQEKDVAIQRAIALRVMAKNRTLIS